MEKEEEEEDAKNLKISRKASTMSNFETSEEATNKLNDVLSSGSLLDNDTKVLMGSRFGYDFSRVSIHKDEKSRNSAELLDANAFTVGSHIVFNQDKYEPHQFWSEAVVS